MYFKFPSVNNVFCKTVSSSPELGSRYFRNANAPMVNLGMGIIEPVDQFTKSNRGLVGRTLTDGPEKVSVKILN